MLDSMRLQLRRSEISERLAALSAKTDALTDDELQERSKLTDEFQATEAAYRKAVADEAIEETEHAAGSQAGDGERRELLQLQQRASLVNYIDSARSRRPVDGAEAELNEALNIGSAAPGEFPLRLLAPEAEAPQAIQQRADVVTNLGAVDTSVTARPWLQRLFLDDTEMGFLAPCVTFESQASGVALLTRITGGTAAGAVARGAQRDAAAMTLETAEVTPELVSVAYVLDQRDRARFGSQLDAALRADMRMALRDQVAEILLSGSAAPAIQGLLDTAKVTTATAFVSDAGTKKFTYTDLLAELAKLLNGKEARRPADLKLLWGRPATTQLLSTLAVAETGLTQWAGLAAQGYMGMTTDRITAMLAASANVGIAARAGAGAGAFRSIVWDRGQLIADPYTAAAKAQERLTVNMQLGNAFIRPSAFAMLKIKA